MMDTKVKRAAPPGDAITERDLCAWLGFATPGDQLVYHRGFLAIDVAPTNDRLAKRERAELLRVARRAMFAAENGLVHLLQRRNGPDDFIYLLVARHRPTTTGGSLEAILGEAALSCPISVGTSIS